MRLLSQLCFLALVGLGFFSFARAEVLFEMAPRYQIGLNTEGSVFADLDADGFIDVAAVNGGQENPQPTISILYGNANGGFDERVILPSYTIGRTITAGDLNRDGRPELVIGSLYQNVLGVFKNLGNRQFGPPSLVAPPAPVGEYRDLAIADFNGDGKNDVVALQGVTNQRLRFFDYSTLGVLNLFATLEQFETGTSYERVIATGDVNGDGRTDLVFAGGGPFGVRNIAFVYGQPSGGTLALTYGFPVEDKAIGLEVVDLDRDGDNDLVVTFYDTYTPTEHSIQIFRNTGGSFSLAYRLRIDGAFPPSEAAVGDFDNDGNKDIAVLLGSVYNAGTMVMIAHGTGGLNYSVSPNEYYGVSRSTKIRSFDVDRDDRDDLVVASTFLLQTNYQNYVGISNNSINVLINKGPSGFEAPRVTRWTSALLGASDLNSDGYMDLVTSWTTTYNGTSSLDVSLNDRRRGLLPELSFDTPEALVDMKIADLNGDGKADVVTAHGYQTRQVAVYLGNGTGALSPPFLTTFTSPLVKIVVVDFNSDGRKDVFAVTEESKGYVMFSDTNGTLHPASSPPITLSDYSLDMIPGDFNGDSKTDILVARQAVWLGDGAGQLTLSAFAVPPILNTAIGDLNGDGRPDIVGLTGQLGNILTAYLGTGTGFATGFSKEIKNFNYFTVQSLVVGDLDGNGRDDVAMIMMDNVFGNLITVSPADTGTAWEEPKYLGLGTASKKLVAADFDGNGRDDLGYLGDNCRGVLYSWPARDAASAMFDYDADGKTDFSVFRPASGAWYLQRSTAGVQGLQFGAEGDRLTPADFDGDGKTDIAVYRPADGTWYILNSATSTVTYPVFGVAEDLPAPGDYDGDGKADLTVFRPSQGTWYRQNSSNGSFFGFQFGANGDVPTVGDFDGDGKNDLGIWRPSNGDWYNIRSSNGSVFGERFGQTGDKIAPADYDGDGKTDIAIFRPSTGLWVVRNSATATYSYSVFGSSSDIPISGDYDGDGKADIGVWRSSDGTWYIQRSDNGQFIVFPWGQDGDRPTPSAYGN